MAVAADGPAPSARSTGVFRPNALPPEIEAHRLAALLEVAMPGGAIASINRLGVVAVELSVQRDFATFAEAVASLARWAKTDDAAAAEAARNALGTVINDGTLAGLIALVRDPRAAPAGKQAALTALGGVGERAVPALFDAYVGAADRAARAAFGGALRAAGPASVRHLAGRAATEHVDSVRAAAALLGRTGSAESAPVLALLVRHADPGVRAATVGALARLGGGEAGRLVMAALHDREPAVRLGAARAAARLADHGFGPILLGRLKEETDEAVVAALIDALGRLREARAGARPRRAGARGERHVPPPPAGRARGRGPRAGGDRHARGAGRRGAVPGRPASRRARRRAASRAVTPARGA